MWETVQNCVEKHHPSKAVAVGAMNLFNDNAMSYFREILKGGKSKCHWIGSLLKSHKKKKSTDSSDSVSDSGSRPTQ
jgi:hypothetical protein